MRDKRYSFMLKEGHRFSGYIGEDGKRVLHSFDDAPAVIYADGTSWWYVDGKVSRLNDKPAVIWGNGVEEFFVNGVRHRDTKEAVLIPNLSGIHPRMRGLRQWWNRGVLIRENRR